MLSLYSSALDVAWKPGKVHVLLVATKQPKVFYQVVKLPQPKFSNRLSDYLRNASEARFIESSARMNGILLFMGFCSASEFKVAKAQLRHLIGPDSVPDAESRAISALKGNGIKADYSFEPNIGLEIMNRDDKPATDLKTLATFLNFSTLDLLK